MTNQQIAKELRAMADRLDPPKEDIIFLAAGGGWVDSRKDAFWIREKIFGKDGLLVAMVTYPGPANDESKPAP